MKGYGKSEKYLRKWLSFFPQPMFTFRFYAYVKLLWQLKPQLWQSSSLTWSSSSRYQLLLDLRKWPFKLLFLLSSSTQMRNNALNWKAEAFCRNCKKDLAIFIKLFNMFQSYTYVKILWLSKPRLWQSSSWTLSRSPRYRLLLDLRKWPFK